MITKYPPDFDVTTIQEPYHLWINGDELVIFTGDDMPEEPPDIIQVEAWQLRLAFNNLDLRDSVEAIIQGSGDKKLQDLWEYFLLMNPIILLFYKLALL